MDNKVINALDKEEEIMHERDEALTFQDNIKNLLQGDNYQRVHSLTQTWQKANQHLELTSTS